MVKTNEIFHGTRVPFEREIKSPAAVMLLRAFHQIQSDGTVSVPAAIRAACVTEANEAAVDQALDIWEGSRSPYERPLALLRTVYYAESVFCRGTGHIPHYPI